MSLIVVRLFGGLGNQLFQYAFGRKIAIANHSDLILDDEYGFIRDVFQREPMLRNFNINAKHLANVKEAQSIVPNRIVLRLMRYLMASCLF